MNLATLALSALIALLAAGLGKLRDDVTELRARLQRAEAAAEFCGCPKVD